MATIAASGLIGRVGRGWLASLVCIGALLCNHAASGQSRELLGEGDTVRISVFQNPDLSTETRISQRGTISFPLIGEVAIGGLAPVEAEGRIAALLERGRYVINPQVNVNVTRLRSRQVTVLGQVTRPGRYALEDPSSGVTDLLAQAGGITATGDENVVVVATRDGRQRREEVNIQQMVRKGDLSSNLQLEAGDTIYVPRMPVFYIYGEVVRAGAYRLEPVMTVMQALALGGGVTPRGTERNLQIRRRGPDGAVRTIDAAPDDTLLADDVVYVRESLF